MPSDTFATADQLVSAESDLSADTPVMSAEDVALSSNEFHQPRSCKIIVDSSADFSPEVLRRLDLELIPFTYVTPEGEVTDDQWASQTPREFYDAFRKDPSLHYTTCAITPGHYLEVFEKAAKSGVPTIYVCLSAGLSSSIQNAEQAAEMLREQYPDFELYVLDPCCDSVAVELLVIEMARQASKGLSAREVYEWACESRYFVHGFFTLENLNSLAAGGRIPPAAAQVGGKLDIKPELSYDTNGALTLCGVCRGRKKALRSIIEHFRESYSQDTSLPLAIVSSDAEKDAAWLDAQVRKVPGCERVAIIHSTVGPILGSHVGPGMVALVFWGGDRREKLSLTDRIARKVRGGMA